MKHEFVAAFIEALYFADTGEEGQPSVNAPISVELRARIEADTDKFIELVEQSASATCML